MLFRSAGPNSLMGFIAWAPCVRLSTSETGRFILLSKSSMFVWFQIAGDCAWTWIPQKTLGRSQIYSPKESGESFNPLNQVSVSDVTDFLSGETQENRDEAIRGGLLQKAERHSGEILPTSR